MAVGDRSLTDILHDSLRNLQEIVRSEVRLAKTEIREEAVKAKSSVIWLGLGLVAAMFSLLFLLFALVYALALWVPMWAAALSVGAVLAIVGTVTLSGGVKRFKTIHPPERTVETIKENVEWAKQHAK